VPALGAAVPIDLTRRWRYPRTTGPVDPRRQHVVFLMQENRSFDH
jgi:phospholipase C